jgi:hypothetical protein
VHWKIRNKGWQNQKGGHHQKGGLQVHQANISCTCHKNSHMSTNDPKVIKQITKESKLVPSSDQDTSTIVGSIGETNLQHYKKPWLFRRPT